MRTHKSTTNTHTHTSKSASDEGTFPPNSKYSTPRHIWCDGHGSSIAQWPGAYWKKKNWYFGNNDHCSYLEQKLLWHCWYYSQCVFYLINKCLFSFICGMSHWIAVWFGQWNRLNRLLFCCSILRYVCVDILELRLSAIWAAIQNIP